MRDMQKIKQTSFIFLKKIELSLLVYDTYIYLIKSQGINYLPKQYIQDDVMRQLSITVVSVISFILYKTPRKNTFSYSAVVTLFIFQL